MAVDMFLKWGEIKGESGDAKHKGEIDVLAWSCGASQSGTTHMGTGGGAGKVSVNDLSFTKFIDRSSPDLLLYICSGKHVKNALLTVRKAGGDPLEYLKINMEDLIISGLSTGGSGGEDRLTENITLNFARMKYDYTPQKPDGTADSPLTTGWDIAANVKL